MPVELFWYATTPCPAFVLHMGCLYVNDYEVERRDRHGKLLSCSSTIGDLRLPLANRKWLWEIAPLGECSGKFSPWRRVAVHGLNIRRS